MVQIEQGLVPLRCWWNNPHKESKHVVLVLPEVFGINNWVRSFVYRLAEKGIPALAMPFSEAGEETVPVVGVTYSNDNVVVASASLVSVGGTNSTAGIGGNNGDD